MSGKGAKRYQKENAPPKRKMTDIKNAGVVGGVFQTAENFVDWVIGISKNFISFYLGIAKDSTNWLFDFVEGTVDFALDTSIDWVNGILEMAAWPFMPSKPVY